ncbi:hypothetical protein MSM1_20015 [Mycobacterium sp. SM1]|uniref:hypothetical protein n=1 Tax=Mycobacterium sp. SM1 TaxID=2816243 RepID=UPI001BCB8144|nr:hypothetical protein [Mycobacterium sp. SM1]MBS4730509.1 hypothetical protein [Mycobacterium sp. SM1]
MDQKPGAAATKLTGSARKTAEAHVEACEAFADDVAAGWALAATGPVHECLRLDVRGDGAAAAQLRREDPCSERD